MLPLFSRSERWSYFPLEAVPCVGLGPSGLIVSAFDPMSGGQRSGPGLPDQRLGLPDTRNSSLDCSSTTKVVHVSQRNCSARQSVMDETVPKFSDPENAGIFQFPVLFAVAPSHEGPETECLAGGRWPGKPGTEQPAAFTQACHAWLSAVLILVI